MTSVGKILGALGVAIVFAFTMAVPSIGTVSTWKIVLGATGIALFVLAERG